MPKTPKLVPVVKVFLSSPGDVTEERLAARKVIDILRESYRDSLSIDLVSWDTPDNPTAMEAIYDPQEAIDKNLPKPSDCDIVIVIFWRRMGSILDRKYVKPVEFRFATGTEYAESRYLSGTEYEYVNAMQAAKNSGVPRVFVYRNISKPENKHPSLPNEAKEEAYQSAHIDAFFRAFKNTEGSPCGSYNSYAKCEDFQQMLRGHLDDALKRIMERRQPAWPKGRSPFPGLRAFTEDEESIYFGRTNEIESLLRLLESSRFVAVVGASGSGKSSLVAAGLIPKLKEGWIQGHAIGSSHWKIVSFRPGNINPLEALCGALPVDFRGGASTAELSGDLKRIPRAMERIWEEARNAGVLFTKILLIVDQFEELFSPEIDDGLRMAFVEVIDVCAGSDRFKVLVTLRADFYHRCLEFQSLTRLLRETGSFPLASPDPPALIEMISGPVKRANLDIPSDLISRIAQDTGSARGNLPLMAYTLEALYKISQSKYGITLDDYEALGGIKGAIGKRAEEMFRKLAAKLNEEGVNGEEVLQTALKKVFLHLIKIDANGNRTRRRAAIAEFAGDAAAELLIKTFSDPDVRLFVPDDPVYGGNAKQSTATIEVAHEALLQKDTWSRVGKWIDENAGSWQMVAQLSQAASEWNANARASSYLWHAERLEKVRAVLKQWPHLKERLAETERAFMNPQEEANSLQKELQALSITHRRRREIGERLCEIGDSRTGVGLRKDRLPEIAWCLVPANERVKIGSRHQFSVKEFYISKYPATCSQFIAFANDPNSLQNPSWWEGISRPAKLTKDRPANYPEKPDNYPQTYVTWCEAIAFCRWLTDQMPPDGWPADIDRTSGWIIRLPTEWEWQQAATGGKDECVYSWGATWDSRRANSVESGLGGPIAVGLYPDGNSPCQVCDMIGNIQEWCLNDFADVGNIEGTCNERQQRALRGGSFATHADQMTCSSRSGRPPQNAKPSRGFRVACALPPKP